MAEQHTFGPVPVPSEPFARADLEIYGIDHFRPSYVADIYFNAGPDDPGAVPAGHFTIFGHDRCVGDEGHCDVPDHKRRFDDRPTSPLTKAFKRVVVTEPLRSIVTTGVPELRITIVANVDPADEGYDGTIVDIEGLQLALFA